MPARGRGSTRGRGGRGGGRGKKTGRPSNGASTSRKSTGRPWDDSDSDNARPDFYSDSDHSDLDSDDLSSPLRGKKTVIKLPGLEDEADDVDDEEMSEAGSFSADEQSRDQWSESRKTPTPDTFVCPWVEASDSLPALTLPPSSDDLLLPSNILFEALEVYEVCRTFYSSIKLSPFLFEDMCAALLAQEQSRLLAEMHINLLKLLLKDDEDEQIVFCPTDMNNTANIVIHLLEPMTYAEVLRQYIESDPMRFPADVLAAVSKGNYPFVPIRQRLTVLGWLCDRFLQSGEFRRIVRREGRIEHDEHCRDCGKPGNVILCDGCEACYHLVCTDLKTVPDGQWLCGICQLHKVVGVHDCTSPLDRSRQPIRQEPIGFDRHGRRYWYLVRRIFVQDENTGQLWYYSSLPQFRQLCALLDPVDYEWRLCAVFQDILPSIVKQMRTT
uniref:Uncharacterized protein n=1 Tax=Plectus sambesii TaxID=2011161 RepID=A0A914XJD3_9BILA